MDNIKEEIDSLQELYDLTSSGEWYVLNNGFGRGINHCPTVYSVANQQLTYIGFFRDPYRMINCTPTPCLKNAEFCADIHTLFPLLISYIKELEAKVEEYEKK